MNDKEKYFQIFGETKCIKDWYKDQRMTSDIGYTTLVNRLNSGMDPKIAISKPKTKITINYNKFRQPTYYNLNITDKKTIVQLYHNLYKNNLFALKRKKDQFKKIIRYIEKKANP